MQPAQGGRIHRTGWAVSAEPPRRIRRNAQFLAELRQNAPQLTAVERWCRILARALIPYLYGRRPSPPANLLPA
jgi:hypothetical protein